MAMRWCVWQSVSRRLNERVVISGRASCREGSRMKSLVLVLVFLAWFVTPAIADFDAGMAAYQRGDYVTAFREFKPLAEKGADRKSTRLNSSHLVISYAVFCLKKKKKNQ